MLVNKDSGFLASAIFAFFLGIPLIQDIAAQTPVFNFSASTGSSIFGFVAKAAGDVNGDGYQDFLVTDPLKSTATTYNTGEVKLMSGFDGQPIYTLTGTGNCQGFGTAAGLTGNLIIVAAVKNCPASPASAVYVYLASTGTLLGTIPIEAYAVASVDDLTGDGIPDIAIGSPLESSNGLGFNGKLRIYDGVSLSLVSSISGTVSYSAFGSPIANISDLDGDGKGDLLVGAGNGPSGTVHVISGTSSLSTIYTISGNAGSYDHFGSAIADIGDVNADGFHDFAVGAPDASANGNYSGNVSIFSGIGGTLLQSINGPFSSKFGSSIAAVGDIDNDGIKDFLVGAPLENSFSGAVRAYSGVSGVSLFTLAGSSGTSFGQAVSGLGDINLDNSPEFIVAAPGNNSVSYHGGVKVYSSVTLPSASTSSIAAPCPPAMPVTVAASGPPILGSMVTYTITSPVPNAPGYALMGFSASNPYAVASCNVYVDFTNPNFLLILPFQTDAVGLAEVTIPIPTVPALIGYSYVFQAGTLSTGPTVPFRFSNPIYSTIGSV